MGAAANRDRITLAGVKLQPRIGVTSAERELPQACQADITIWCDFSAAAASDALADSLDYRRLLESVLESAHEREYNLVEALAYRIARDLLQKFPAHRVQVKVRKRPAELLDRLDFVEVEMQQP